MNSIHANQSTGLLRTAMVLICVFLLSVLTVGCGDDQDSFESKLEEARIAIDDSQYSKAITVLDGMTGQEVLEVRASAYAGLAGIDTFEILSQVDDGGTGDGSIDLIGRMLGTGDDDTLTAAAIDDKLVQIDLAKATLLDSVGGNIAALDDDGKAKLAIYGFTDIVLTLGKVISFKDVSGGGDGDVTLTETAIRALPEVFSVGDLAVVSMDDLSDDLDYIALGITALGGATNDLAEEFEAFRSEITKGDGVLSDEDFVAYINEL